MLFAETETGRARSEKRITRRRMWKVRSALDSRLGVLCLGTAMDCGSLLPLTPRHSERQRGNWAEGVSPPPSFLAVFAARNDVIRAGSGKPPHSERLLNATAA